MTKTSQLPQQLLASLVLIFTISISLAHAADWPQWRGPDGDGLSKETGLLKEWPEGGPKVLWEIDNAGVGYSSLAIVDGRIFTQGDLEGVEHILCFSEKDGSLIWAVQPEPVKAKLDAMIAERFAQADKNSDGKLDQKESLDALGEQALAADGASEGNAEEIAAARAADLLAAFDEDGDGSLGVKEIPVRLDRQVQNIDEAVRGNFQEIAEKRTQQLLAALDGDGDGNLTREEIRNTIAQQFNRADKAPEGEKSGDGVLSAAELTEYFAKADKGRDGVLTKAEIEAYFVKNHPGRDGILNQADLKRAIGGYRNGQGDGPRGTPTVVGDKVYTEGGNGDVTCLSAADGSTVWHVNLVDDFGGGRPGWGYSESALLVGNSIVVTPGGKDGTVIALHKDTGELVWRSAGVTEPAHYATAVVAEIGGKPQIVQFARESVFGLDAENGEILWNYSGANNGTANCSSPIVANDHVLVSSAYGTGTGMVSVKANPETGFKAEEKYFEKELQSHHGGLIKVGNHVYGFSGGSLMCLDFMSGEIAWQDRSVSKGAVVYADGMLYCLGERHEVALVEAKPDAYVEHGRFTIENLGRPSWAHPVVANGRFYIRNQQKLTCYDVKVTD